MDKPWWQSRTIWGAVILGVTGIVAVLPISQPLKDGLLAALGFVGSTFFGVGVRNAIAANGTGK